MAKGGAKITKDKKEENDQKAVLGRAVATKKQQAKEFAYAREQTNNQFLIVFYSGEGCGKWVEILLYFIRI